MKTNQLIIKAKAAIYAQVLLEAAQASDSVFALTSEFDLLQKTLDGSAELYSTLTNRYIPAADRQRIALEVFAGLRPELLAVLGVMVERVDLAALAKTHSEFERQAEVALGAVIIDVTTAVPLNAALRSAIVEKYGRQLGSGVLLREHVDPAVVGGIILELHGKRIDASVVSQLEKARATLSKP